MNLTERNERADKTGINHHTQNNGKQNRNAYMIMIEGLTRVWVKIRDFEERGIRVILNIIRKEL